MAREQGDDLGNEVVYVREKDGKTQERRAYTPADHVNLQARGWVRRDKQSPAQPAPAKAAPAAPKPAANPAGESA